MSGELNERVQIAHTLAIPVDPGFAALLLLEMPVFIVLVEGLYFWRRRMEGQLKLDGLQLPRLLQQTQRERRLQRELMDRLLRKCIADRR